MPFFNLGSLGLPTSQAQYLQIWLTAMQQAFPGYTPSEGNLEYVQAQVFASWAADLGSLCSQGSSELFRQFGLQLLGLPYQPGVSATTTLTVNAVDSAGHTLFAGAPVQLTLNGQPVAFQTVQALTIPPGSTSGTVTIAAVQSGSVNNGAGAPASLLNSVDWVSSVTVTAPASGGVNQETDDSYLARLASQLRLLAPRPITAHDFAQMALSFTPIPGSDQQEVGRAAAIDGYDPPTGTYGNEREVTVAVTDSNGNPLNSDTMYGIGGSPSSIVTDSAQWGVAGWLASMREVNFIVNVVAPNYFPVFASVTVAAAPGYAPATVAANVQSALLGYLSPVAFALPQQSLTGWQATQTVRRSIVEATVQNAPGVAYILPGTLALGLSGPPQQTTGDLVISAPFPLPTSSASTIPLSAIQVVQGD